MGAFHRGAAGKYYLQTFSRSTIQGTALMGAANRSSGARSDIVVVGDAILDVWQEVERDGFCREAPIQRYSVISRHVAAGGAANTALSIIRLSGLPVDLVSGIGEDAEGGELRHEISNAGVAHLDLPSTRTPHRTRVIESGRMVSRFDGNSGHGADEVRMTTKRVLRDRLTQGCELLVIADYATGSIDMAAVRDVVRELRSLIGTLVIDSHSIGNWGELNPDVITPDIDEIGAMCPAWASELERSPEETIRRHSTELLNQTGARKVALTLGADGALLVTEAGVLRVPAPIQSMANNIVGAGDVFAAAIGIGFQQGLTDEQALSFATRSATAAVVDARSMTTVVVPTLKSKVPRPKMRHQRIDDLESLRAVVERQRALGRTVALTNGCFDLLHAGHVSALEHAGQLADVLIVAINSDASVKALKGAQRPINPEADRARVLLALECVQYVYVFEEQTVDHVIEALAPDVYLKGGDYSLQMVERERNVVMRHGGRVVISPYVSGRSTSETVARIELAALR